MKCIAATLSFTWLLVANNIFADDYTFALVPTAMNNPFSDLARDGCYKAQEELNGVTCQYIGSAQQTISAQTEVILDLVAQGVDGIAVAPSDVNSMSEALQTAMDAGIPVVTWNADLVEQDQKLRNSHIGASNYEIGLNLGMLAKSRHPEGGTIFIQTLDAANTVHRERVEGVRAALSKNSDAEDPFGTCCWQAKLDNTNGWTEIDGSPLVESVDAGTAVQSMGNVLEANPDLTVFISTTGFSQSYYAEYRQVTRDYKNMMQSGDLSIIVGSTSPNQIELAREGLGSGLVGEQPYDMAYKAINALNDIVSGKTVEDKIFSEINICSLENLDSCAR